MQITIPRWAQLVLIPLGVIVALFLLGKVSHAVFVFLMASLLTLLLNPIVESLRKVYVPRALGVPLVYLTFAALLVLLLLIGVPPLIDQGQKLLARTPEWTATVEEWARDAEGYLDSRGLTVDLEAALDRTMVWIQNRAATSAPTLFNFTVDVVGSLATFLLVVIISFYMLIDGRRIHRYLRRLVPGDEHTAEAYLDGIQQSFTRYVKGQLLLASSVGLAAGLGIWALGWDAIGIWPEGSQYALLFGFWAGVTEVIPFIGPFLGAAPAVALALFQSPGTALWVAAVYFAVQQLENHILVPNIIGTSMGVHPLAVIFALLAGAQIGGIVGMLAVLPVLAIIKHTLDFYDFRLSRAAWIADDGMALPAAPRSLTEEGAQEAIMLPTEPDTTDPSRERPPGAAEDRGAGGPGEPGSVRVGRSGG